MKSRQFFAAAAAVAVVELTGATPALGGVTIAPYASIKSEKTIKPTASAQEQSNLQERQEYGLRAAVGIFGSLFSLQLSAGQNKLTTTTQVQNAADEYGQINFQKDLNMATSQPTTLTKITEIQRNGKANLTFDPSFGIIILRATAGITATQRILTADSAGGVATTKTVGPIYKPNSGFGFGIRLTPGTYFLAEYDMYHYAFPKLQPFEREVAVTYGVTL